MIGLNASKDGGPWVSGLATEDSSYHQGWPIAFWHSFEHVALPEFEVLERQTTWHIGGLVFGVATWLLLVFATATTVETWQANGIHFQFTLRMLLALVGVVAIVAGLYTSEIPVPMILPGNKEWTESVSHCGLDDSAWYVTVTMLIAIGCVAFQAILLVFRLIRLLATMAAAKH